MKTIYGLMVILGLSGCAGSIEQREPDQITEVRTIARHLYSNKNDGHVETSGNWTYAMFYNKIQSCNEQLCRTRKSIVSSFTLYGSEEDSFSTKTLRLYDDYDNGLGSIDELVFYEEGEDYERLYKSRPFGRMKRDVNALYEEFQDRAAIGLGLTPGNLSKSQEFHQKMLEIFRKADRRAFRTNL